jgi:hypothetical protein
MAKKNKGADATAVMAAVDGAALTGQGIRLSAHPRARRQIGIAKGWGGLLAFLVALKLSRGAALPWPDAIERAVIAGVVGYVVAWGIAQTIWRHLALAELEQLRRKLIAMTDAQTAQRAAAIADAQVAAAAAAGTPSTAVPEPVPQA